MTKNTVDSVCCLNTVNSEVEDIYHVGNRPEKEICLVANVRDRQNRVVSTKVVFDTGNGLDSPTAISADFHRRLGVGFSKLDTRSIGTALKGSSMPGLGYSNPIKIKLEGIKKSFLLKPRVIEHLHTDLNIGNLFLKQVEANMNFSMDKTVLTIGEDSAELIQSIGQDEENGEHEPRERVKKTVKRKREKSVGFIQHART